MKRALLVGINAYPGNELRGCVNDVADMAEFLVAKLGFEEGDVRIVTDRRATTVAIRERLQWLVAGARSGDRLFFHYSGHGVTFPMRDPHGKVTRVDECICPVDFDWSDGHVIRDKEFERLFTKLPKGVRLTWVSDSCYSGNLARAMAPRRTPKRDKTIPMPVDIAWRMRTANVEGAKRPGFEHVFEELNGVLVSGCSKRETSSDAVFDGRSNGALTYYLLKQLKTPRGLQDTLEQVVVKVRAALKRNSYQQHPQMQGSAALMDAPFFAAARPKRARRL